MHTRARLALLAAGGRVSGGLLCQARPFKPPSSCLTGTSFPRRYFATAARLLSCYAAACACQGGSRASSPSGSCGSSPARRRRGVLFNLLACVHRCAGEHLRSLSICALRLQCTSGFATLTAPTSRLYTGSVLWATASRSLGGNLDAAIGVDPRLYPTLFGVRLVNDPQVSTGMADVCDVLEWMPHCLPSLCPQLAAGALPAAKECMPFKH